MHSPTESKEQSINVLRVLYTLFPNSPLKELSLLSLTQVIFFS